MKCWWFWVIIGSVVLGIGLVNWIGVRGWQAKSELEAAQTMIRELKAQAVALNITSATSTLDAIKAHTSNAVGLTDDLIWRAGERIPGLGSNLTAVRELAVLTNTVMTDVATPLMTVAGGINPASFAPKDGAIDLQPLVAAVPAIAQSNAGIKTAIETVNAVNTAGTLHSVARVQYPLLRRRIVWTLR